MRGFLVPLPHVEFTTVDTGPSNRRRRAVCLPRHKQLEQSAQTSGSSDSYYRDEVPQILISTLLRIRHVTCCEVIRNEREMIGCRIKSGQSCDRVVQSNFVNDDIPHTNHNTVLYNFS